MGVRIDTTYDHEDLAEAPETISYGSKTNEAPPATKDWIRIDYVEVFPINKSMMESTHLLAEQDVTMRLAKHKLKGIVPKQHDLWKRKDGTYWVVGLVEILSFGNEYRVHSQKSTLR